MFILRNKQIEALGLVKLRSFERRAAAHVRACFPAACDALGGDGVDFHVRHAIARGLRHRLEYQSDLLRFVNLVFALGEDFDDVYPWAREILDDDELAPRTKLGLLV